MLPAVADRHGKKMAEAPTTISPKPPWLRKRLSAGPAVREVEKGLRNRGLHTICEEGRCPNRGECFSRRVATLLIMGSVCTRNCTFCAVRSGSPRPLDPEEPARVAEEVAALGLRFVVITSVTRDDLPDGGAGHFARVTESIRTRCPGVGMELLVPDFGGSERSLAALMKSAPDVIAHNMETAARFYPAVRPRADYHRSLGLLKRAAGASRDKMVKSGFMVGLGEGRDDVIRVMEDLRGAGCDMLTVGQYLAPSRSHHPVIEYIRPEIFDEYRQQAKAMGFRSVASGPFVRSSYLAEHYYRETGNARGRESSAAPFRGLPHTTTLRVVVADST